MRTRLQGGAVGELEKESQRLYLHCVGTYFAGTVPAGTAAPISAAAVVWSADAQAQSILPHKPAASAALLM